MISENDNLRAKLEEQLRFETLLADLSARFINVPPDEVDREIEDAQRRIVELLGLDRSTLFQNVDNAEDVNLVTTHCWARPGLMRFPTVFLKQKVPWLTTQILLGKMVRYSSFAELPPEAARDVATFSEHGPLSNVTFPLTIGGKVFGALAFGSMLVEREWTDFLVNRLRLVAEIFTSAIDRQRSSRALQESETRFRMVADSAPVLIWMAGTDKLCNFFNKGWLDFTGRTMEQELGDGWAEGVHHDDLAGCLKSYGESFDARRPFTLEYRLRHHDGEYRWLSDTGVPRYDDQRNFLGYIGCCLDLTERKLGEAEARQQREELAHLSRVTMLGQLSSSLAHELNQPLGAILRNAEAAELFLQDASPDLEELRAILADIRRDDQRAGAVISRMRSLVKRREVERSLFDPNLLAADVLNLVRSDADARKVRLVFKPVSSVPPVRGDRVQLQQVMLNLLLNAMDAVNDSVAANRRVMIRIQPAGALVEVAVSDRRPRHTRRQARPRVRAVLHHQTKRHGHGPADFPQHRGGTRRTSFGGE